MSDKKAIIDCKSWSLVISLRRYGVADIEIEIPLSGDEDPRGSLVIDTSRYNGVASAEEVREAIDIYGLLWEKGGPTDEAKELANKISSVTKDWFRKYIMCRQG